MTSTSMTLTSISRHFSQRVSAIAATIVPQLVIHSAVAACCVLWTVGWVLGAGCWVLGAGCWVLGAVCCVCCAACEQKWLFHYYFLALIGALRVL